MMKRTYSNFPLSINLADPYAEQCPLDMRDMTMVTEENFEVSE